MALQNSSSLHPWWSFSLCIDLAVYVNVPWTHPSRFSFITRCIFSFSLYISTLRCFSRQKLSLGCSLVLLGFIWSFSLFSAVNSLLIQTLLTQNCRQKADRSVSVSFSRTRCCCDIQQRRSQRWWWFHASLAHVLCLSLFSFSLTTCRKREKQVNMIYNGKRAVLF